MVTGVDAVTGDVVMLKAAVIAPEGTVTVAGTPAAVELELVSVTTAPEDGAGRFSVTVFVVVAVPPVTVPGLRVIADIAIAQYNGAPAPPNSYAPMSMALTIVRPWPQLGSRY